MVEAHAEASPYPNPHSPAERRKLSNLGHWQQGGVLGAAGGLALVDGVRPELGWPGRYSARSGAAAGLALAGFIVLGSFHHGGPVLYLRHEH
jgi:hypothetical protein